MAAEGLAEVGLKGVFELSEFNENMERYMAATQQSGEAADEAGSKLDILGGVFQGVGQKVATFVIEGLQKLWGELNNLVPMAGADEASVVRLGAAVAASGADVDIATEAITNYIAAQQQKVGIDDGSARQAVQRLIETTGDYNSALALMPIVLDLAAAKQMDLSTAAMMVGRVAQGNTSALTRYGIVLKEGATATEALEELQKRFAGQSEAMAATYEGSMNRMQAASGELKEAVGSLFLEWKTQANNAMADLMFKVLPEIEAFAGVVGPAIASGMKMVSDSLWAIGDALGLSVSSWTGVAGEGGQALGNSFAEGIASALPYIVGVIQAIGAIISYWFAPGSPPKVAEDIDAWGAAMVTEYFKSFSGADFSPITSFANKLQGTMEDALEYGLLSEQGASAMLGPLQTQFGAMFQEFANAGAVSEDSFAKLRSMAGAIGPQVERLAREFLTVGASGSGAGAGSAAGAAAAEKAAKEAEAGGGGGGGRKAADLSQWVTAATTGVAAGASGGAFKLDPEAILGQANKIRDGITNTLFPIFDNLVSAWNTGYAKVMEMFGGIKGWVDLNWPGVRDTVVGAFEGAKSWVETNWPAFQASAQGALQGVYDWVGLNWPQVETWLTGAFSTAKTWVETNWPTFETAVTGVLQGIQTWVSTTWSGGGEDGAGGVGGMLQAGLQTAYDWVEENWPTFETNTTTSLQAIYDWVAANWPVLVRIITEGNVTTQQVTETSLGAAWVNWHTTWSLIVAWVEEAWARITAVFDAGIAWLDATFGPFVQMLTQWWREHGENVVYIANTLWDAVKAIFGAAIAVVGGAVKGFLFLVKGLWDAWKDDIGAIVSATWETIKSIFKLGTDNIGTVVDIFAALLKGDFLLLGKEIGEGWQTLWNDVKDVVSKAVSQVVTTVGAMFDNIKQTIDNWTKPLQDLGMNIIRSIVKGIEDNAKAVSDSLGSVVDKAIQAILSALGIHSPSTVLANMIGRPMAEGVAAGILKGGGSIQAAMGQVVGGAWGGMSPYAAGVAGGGGAQVNIGGVSIYSGIDEALFEARVQAAVSAALEG